MAKTDYIKPTIWEHTKSILLLPFMVLVIIPSIVIYCTKEIEVEILTSLPGIPFQVFGVLLLMVGAFLFVRSIDLFVKIGNGTLAPWNPTQKLVVKGLYRHVRNPMILGVLSILLAEALIFKSIFVFCWFGIFFVANQFYFILKEEPDLLKRFGEEYLVYKRNVPRWIPRWKGWCPEKE